MVGGGLELALVVDIASCSEKAALVTNAPGAFVYQFLLDFVAAETCSPIHPQTPLSFILGYDLLSPWLLFY